MQIRVNRGFVQGKVDTSGTAAKPAEQEKSDASTSGTTDRARTALPTTLPSDDRMRRRRLWASLIGCVGITVVLLLLNLGFRNTPVLGLDLQGGVSVVLAPDGRSDG